MSRPLSLQFQYIYKISVLFIVRASFSFKVKLKTDLDQIFKKIELVLKL